MAAPTLDDVPRPVLVVAGLGLIPLVAGAAGAWLLDPNLAGLAIPLQFFYACAALSFLGAVHWGLAIAGFGGGASWVRLAWSVSPALLAWLLTALELEPIQMGLALVLAYPVTLIVDLAATRRGWAPSWYPALRTPLTIVATLSLAVSVWRLA